MLVPGANKAVVDLRKLVSYCLDPAHVVGKHKARVFEKALGISVDSAFQLAASLKWAVANVDAKIGVLNSFGQRYIVDHEMAYNGRTAMVRSVWIVEQDTDFPRLVTCFVL